MAEKRFSVTGDQYRVCHRRMREICRQLDQDGGSPLDPELVANELQKIIESKSIVDGKIVGTFTITCEGSHTASELKELGKYNWSNDWITNEHFPLTKHEPEKRTIEFVKFDHDPSSKEVLAEFACRGLDRPTYEDAFYFGVQYPDEQRKRSIIFLHEPVMRPYSNPLVVELGSDVSDRDLGLYYFEGDWGRSFVFAGVRNPA